MKNITDFVARQLGFNHLDVFKLLVGDDNQIIIKMIKNDFTLDYSLKYDKDNLILNISTMATFKENRSDFFTNIQDSHKKYEAIKMNFDMILKDSVAISDEFSLNYDDSIQNNLDNQKVPKKILDYQEQLICKSEFDFITEQAFYIKENPLNNIINLAKIEHLLYNKTSKFNFNINDLKFLSNFMPIVNNDVFDNIYPFIKFDEKDRINDNSQILINLNFRT